MPYSPTSVANGILELGFRDGVPIDPMKMQKLLYFMHGYYLALAKGEPLVNELFQAWKLGPVLPSIYHKLKKFKGSSITEYGVVYNWESGASVPAAPPETDTKYVEVRKFVWDTYSRMRSIELSEITHNADQAWHRTIKLFPGILGPQIPNASILADFQPLVHS